MISSLHRLSHRIVKGLPAPGTRTWRTYHVVVLTYSIFMLFICVIMLTGIAVTGKITTAQSLQDRIDAARHEQAMAGQISEIEKRMTAIESLNLDRRLTVIETLLKEVNSQTVWGPLSMGGVGLLIFREAYTSLLRRRRPRRDDDDEGDEK